MDMGDLRFRILNVGKLRDAYDRARGEFDVHILRRAEDERDYSLIAFDVDDDIRHILIQIVRRVDRNVKIEELTEADKAELKPRLAPGSGWG
jgi:hypothetical protein